MVVNTKLKGPHMVCMQSQNPTPVLEEAGKASSRHSWFKCLQARQKTILGNNYTQKAPAGSQQHLVRRWKPKWRGGKKHLRWGKTSSASQAALTQIKSKEHHAREGQTTSSTVHFFVGHFEPYRYKIIQHMGMGLNLAYDPIWYYMIFDVRVCLIPIWSETMFTSALEAYADCTSVHIPVASPYPLSGAGETWKIWRRQNCC